MRLLFAALLPLAFCPAGCTPKPPPADVGYQAEIETWRKARVERLTANDGWLSLAGLFWLNSGPNRVGTLPELEVVLPKSAGVAQVGTLTLNGGKLVFEKAGAASVTIDGQAAKTQTLATDADGEPTILNAGAVRFFVIKRGDRFGVRVKDPDSTARRQFHGISYFPIDPEWRVVARFEPFSPARPIEVPNMLGTVDQESSPGEAVFERAGTPLRLSAIEEKDSNELFFVFADLTNGKQTYGAGRFLYAARPENGQVILDFNKAFNPPCSFTPYATCPRPPKDNRLAVAVTAGEKTYAEHK